MDKIFEMNWSLYLSRVCEHTLKSTTDGQEAQHRERELRGHEVEVYAAGDERGDARHPAGEGSAHRGAQGANVLRELVPQVAA